jgi:tRNA(Ile)-lysidine synthase
VQDPSNADLRFFRNRLRHELLPALETYNPNIRAALRRMAEVAAGEHELLDHVIADVWKRVVLAEGLTIEFNRERWLALSVRATLLLRAIQRLP